MNSKIRLALLCGGPSLERGISLNSARSICDHLDSDTIEIVPIYFDYQKKAYEISRVQLYSNTPSDFDFKLHTSARPLSRTALKKLLKETDIAFPAIHGRFGEDGVIQGILEEYNVPYIGSSSESCKICFDKYVSHEKLEEEGFATAPTILLKSHLENHEKLLKDFFSKHNLSRAIVKPARGGSSIGVFSVNNVDEALEAAHVIFSKRMDTRVVVQQFLKGTEFTVIVVQNRFGQPVALMPTEIILNYEENQIFDYRKKYLPTGHVSYFCPPRFDEKHIEQIQIQAEQLFTLFDMQDFARLDGWVLPDGTTYFSDFNPVSGMEQNSFLFQQAAQIGMSHRDFLQFVVKNACRRHDIDFPNGKRKVETKKKDIHVLFGGKTAERQVSLMSGTNVWLKLMRSKEYNPIPFLLDEDHNVWKLPYYLTLHHTVEEIVLACERAIKYMDLLSRLQKRVLLKLDIEEGDTSVSLVRPEKMSLEEFIRMSEFVFIGLHGGMGEDGRLQAVLEKQKKPFNGPGSEASRLCMDKYKTGEKLEGLGEKGIFTALKSLIPVSKFKDYTDDDYIHFWKNLRRELQTRTVIVKPFDDGCSAGIVHLFNSGDIKKYIELLQSEADHIPPHTFHKQDSIIEMPTNKVDKLMFEEFIATDDVRVVDNELHWEQKTDWIEITMGVLGHKGKMKAFNPSITVAYGEVLSLEEKFQGGTGVNITPPPEKYIKPKIVELAKKRMEQVAEVLGLEGYSRIDAFLHTKNGDLIIIEANSLPGLTPATVIYHQALEEKEKMYPTQFLREIVRLGFERYKSGV